jgi:hypothetical protein
MQDLEQRYFERVAAAQIKFNEALDAARTEHDMEVLSAREELNEKATGRFAVLFGKTPQPAPSEAVRGMLEGMIGDVLNKRLAATALAAPTEDATGDSHAPDP